MMDWRNPEERTAYVLGTVGLFKGLGEVFVLPFLKERVVPEITVERIAFVGGVVLGATVANLVESRL